MNQQNRPDITPRPKIKITRKQMMTAAATTTTSERRSERTDKQTNYDTTQKARFSYFVCLFVVVVGCVFDFWMVLEKGVRRPTVFFLWGSRLSAFTPLFSYTYCTALLTSVLQVHTGTTCGTKTLHCSGFTLLSLRWGYVWRYFAACVVPHKLLRKPWRLGMLAPYRNLLLCTVS